VPLTPDEFQLRKQDVEAAVPWFLRDRAPLAFSTDEVLFELGTVGVMYRREQSAQALSNLAADERIESAGADEQLYYRYYRQLGFRPPKV